MPIPMPKDGDSDFVIPAQPIREPAPPTTKESWISTDKPGIQQSSETGRLRTNLPIPPLRPWKVEAEDDGAFYWLVEQLYRD